MVIAFLMPVNPLWAMKSSIAFGVDGAAAREDDALLLRQKSP